MLIDSHCHLNYLTDPAARLTAARAAGVAKFLCISVDEQHFAEVKAISEQHDDVWATVGIHPDATTECTSFDWVRAAAVAERVVGIGETGLDYFRLATTDQVSRNIQRRYFEQHLALAAELELPAIVHTRAAADDTLSSMRTAPHTTGVMHCFTEPWNVAEAALELDYYISMSGIVTFKNAATVREVAKRVPADRLLVETDCPWLAPVPHRGHTNEPAFIKDTAQFLAELRGVSYGELAQQTSANFHRLFCRIET